MRTIATVLFLMALIAAVIDLLPLAGGTPWAEIRFSVVGEVWYRVHPESYQLLEPAISRHVSPLLWEYVVLPLMTAPVALVLGVLALLAWMASGGRRDAEGAGRRRRRHDFRRR